MELLNWTKYSNLHMLIRGCVFHYELELIHPFTDGNGRVRHLWHTLLSKWTLQLHGCRWNLSDAINASNNGGESTIFIEFMLAAIKASLMDAIEMSDPVSDENQIRQLSVGDRLSISYRRMSIS